MELLARRGSAILEDETERVAKLNSKIEGYLRLHSKDNKLLTPDSAFVVFENEKTRRIIMKPKNCMTVGGEKVVFTEPPQPSDIIWENRVKEPRLRKLLIGSVVLCVLFTLDFLATFAFNDAQLGLINKYDTKIDC